MMAGELVCTSYGGETCLSSTLISVAISAGVFVVFSCEGDTDWVDSGEGELLVADSDGSDSIS